MIEQSVAAPVSPDVVGLELDPPARTLVPSLVDGAAQVPQTPTPVVVRRYVRFRADEASAVEEPVIAEIRLRIVVDGQEIVELMCSPHRVRALVLGFLYHEGVIDDFDDVTGMRVCLPDGLAEVWLSRPAPPLPARRIVTSGCTGGVSFGVYLEELERYRLPPDDLRVRPERVYFRCASSTTTQTCATSRAASTRRS